MTAEAKVDQNVAKKILRVRALRALYRIEEKRAIKTLDAIKALENELRKDCPHTFEHVQEFGTKDWHYAHKEINSHKIKILDCVRRFHLKCTECGIEEEFTTWQRCPFCLGALEERGYDEKTKTPRHYACTNDACAYYKRNGERFLAFNKGAGLHVWRPNKINKKRR